MKHLLKLELKKVKWGRHIFGIIMAILFIILFLTISMVDSATDPSQTKDTFQSTMVAESLLMTTIFLIYGAVLTATTIINEYNNRTILILFSYPLHRKKLIFVKLMIIVVFTMVAMVIGHAICFSYILLMDKKFDWIEGAINAKLLGYYLKMVISNIICCGILTGVPFSLGMIKKSVPVTIVSSFGAMFLRQVLVSSGTLYRESPLQLVIIGVAVFAMVYITFNNKVEQVENL